MADNIKGHTVDEMLKEVQDEKKVFTLTPLIKRQFVSSLKKGEQLSSPNTESTIRIMQWNILAQGLCRCTDGFVLCPNEALDWPVRQNLILEELLTYMPDIFCLQEVDHFKFFQQYLYQIDYKGLFFPKPDSPCLYTKECSGPDGCAVFWNKTKFKLLNFDNIVLKRDNGRNTNQVAIICRFRFQSGDHQGQQFFVSTTHLKSKTNYHNLRFQQGQYFERWLQDHCQGVPLIMCGDFNAEPSENVVSVFKESSLGLISSYTLLSEEGSEPSYTTWKVRGNLLGKHEEFRHTIDYLFFTPQHFSCLQLLNLPTGEEIGEGRLPSYSYPSDHLSLIADLQLKDMP